MLLKRPRFLEYGIYFGALAVQFRRMYERYLLANPETGTAGKRAESYPLISSRAAAG
jgi:hypothetical protein